jgi:hypothetical protein
LEKLKPDLVLVTGDVVSGYMWDHSQGYFEKLHKKFTKPFIEHNIPYAFTFGNHDDEADADRNEILTMEMEIN